MINLYCFFFDNNNDVQSESNSSKCMKTSSFEAGKYSKASPDPSSPSPEPAVEEVVVVVVVAVVVVGEVDDVEDVDAVVDADS